MDWAKILEILIKNPMAIFVLLSGLFGYLYWEQNKVVQELTGEVSGLRVEQKKMNEIIKLKIELAESKCKDK